MQMIEIQEYILISHLFFHSLRVLYLCLYSKLNVVCSWWATDRQGRHGERPGFGGVCFGFAYGYPGLTWTSAEEKTGLPLCSMLSVLLVPLSNHVTLDDWISFRVFVLFHWAVSVFIRTKYMKHVIKQINTLTAGFLIFFYIYVGVLFWGVSDSASP